MERWAAILAAISKSQQDGLRLSLFRSGCRYAQKRADWRLMSLEARLEHDADRTRSHDAFIDSCNILSRSMAEVGEDNRWRGLLGDDRKVIGDFACYVHFRLGLDAR